MRHPPRPDDEVAVDRPHTGTTATCFDLLASWQRRFVLLYLSRAVEPVTLGRLADALAADDDALTVADARLELYHLHLPKLADAELVAYDRTTKPARVSLVGAEPDATAARVEAAISELRSRPENHG